jgi:hypothetical protein
MMETQCKNGINFISTNALNRMSDITLKLEPKKIVSGTGFGSQMCLSLTLADGLHRTLVIIYTCTGKHKGE